MMGTVSRYSRYFHPYIFTTFLSPHLTYACFADRPSVFLLTCVFSHNSSPEFMYLTFRVLLVVLWMPQPLNLNLDALHRNEFTSTSCKFGSIFSVYLDELCHPQPCGRGQIRIYPFHINITIHDASTVGQSSGFYGPVALPQIINSKDCRNLVHDFFVERYLEAKFCSLFVTH